MGLHFPSSVTFPIWGSVTRTYLADRVTVDTATRTSVELESSYQAESGVTEATKTIKVSHYSKMNIDILYTMGAAETSNSIEVKIEGSPDGVNFYRIPNDSPTAGVSTLTAREFTFVGTNGAAATISIGLDLFYEYVKISGKETGVAANKGTAYAEVTLLGK